jgi:hypothetical protein
MQRAAEGSGGADAGATQALRTHVRPPHSARLCCRPPARDARRLTSLSRTITWSTRSQKRSSTYQQRGMTRTCRVGACNGSHASRSQHTG